MPWKPETCEVNKKISKLLRHVTVGRSKFREDSIYWRATSFFKKTVFRVSKEDVRVMLTSVIPLLMFTDSPKREANQRGIQKLFVLDVCVKGTFFK